MIRYTLRCHNSHEFDSWFQSATGFDTLQSAGLVACPRCASVEVTKSLMAPALGSARKTAVPDHVPNLTQPQNDIETAFAEMRRQVEANSEYVGMNFVAEARRMHQGEIDARAIYGEAKPAEARALLEEGVPVAPLPFMPKRNAN